jgi:hypothetical protein
MSPFIPLCKADAAQRLVFGRIDETPDRAGEVFDYASSKPEFQAWSKDIQKASDGKSYGNVRAMHGNVAAGKLVGLSFDDVAKSIELCAHIVDDGEWEKVEQGVYTGFSPGGRYLKRWPDGGRTRYTARPSEISIVDLPCIPSAGFTLVKADGIEESVPFRVTDAASGGDVLTKDGARNSKADLERIQSMHDTAVALGASCHGVGCNCHDSEEADEAEEAAPTADLAKATGMLAKVQGELDLSKAENTTLRKRVAELEAQPAPGGPVLRAFSKADDYGAPHGASALEAIRDMPPGTEKTSAIIKAIHRREL